MHCPICDKVDDNIKYIKEEGKFGICGECQMVVMDTLMSYDDPEDTIPPWDEAE